MKQNWQRASKGTTSMFLNGKNLRGGTNPSRSLGLRSICARGQILAFERPSAKHVATRTSTHRNLHYQVRGASGAAVVFTQTHPHQTPAAIAVSPDTDIKDLLRLAMTHMGKPFGQQQVELADRLRDEMYDSAAAVAELSEAALSSLALHLRMPHRLLATMHRLASQPPHPQPPHPQPPTPQPPAPSPPLPPSLHAAAPPPPPPPSPTLQLAPQWTQIPAPTAAAAAAPGPTASTFEGLVHGDIHDVGADEEEQEEEENDDEEEEEEGLRGIEGAVDIRDMEGPVDVRHIPIMERRCPDKFRFGYGSGREVRLRGRPKGESYAITPALTHPALAAELRDFENFCLYGSFAGAAAGKPLRRVTCEGYLQCIRHALGWLHVVEGVPLSDLRLGMLVPGTQRGAARRVHAFLIWQERDRGLAASSVARSLAALIQLAKYLHQEQSSVMEGDKPYSDLEVVKSMRALYMHYMRGTRVAGAAVDPAAKWLDWPAYLKMVGELRREAAGLTASGRRRSPAEVAMSLQAFLIAAILSCVPDRQRTLRELVVGRTMVKDAHGMWTIRHTHADYKTGGTYGERPPLLIDPGLYYELEEFINTWRRHLNPRHDYLFSKRDGSGPLTATELGRSFSLHAYRLTGRKLNPHLVRDMVVTYARDGHASEHELEALAVYMGHSLAEQRGTYDKRTKAQKVQPALGLMAKLGGSGAGLNGAEGPAGARAGADNAIMGPPSEMVMQGVVVSEPVVAEGSGMLTTRVKKRRKP